MKSVGEFLQKIKQEDFGKANKIITIEMSHAGDAGIDMINAKDGFVVVFREGTEIKVASGADEKTYFSCMEGLFASCYSANPLNASIIVNKVREQIDKLVMDQEKARQASKIIRG